MAVTATTHSKPIGWSRSDVIDLIEQAHTTVGAHAAVVSGLVAGVRSYTYGGENTQRSGSNQYDYYYDVFPQTQTGTGSGASFQVTVYSGKVVRVEVNRPGSGYANGDVLTLNDLDFGGNGSNGVQDIQVTVFVEGYAVNGNTYTLQYDFSNNLTGIDANGSITSVNVTSAANITIAEGDTLLLKAMNDDTYIYWYDLANDMSLGNDDGSGNPTYYNTMKQGWAVPNVVNQGADNGNSNEDDKWIKWKPSPGQAGTYYIKQDDTSTTLHTITVVAASASDSVVKNYGGTSDYFDKQNRQAAVAPYGVVRRQVQAGKRFGVTYQAYQFNSDTDGQVEININTGSSFRPTTATLPESYTINGNARFAGGHEGTASTAYDRANYLFDARFKGTPYFDISLNGPDNQRYRDYSNVSYETAPYEEHGRIIADRNAYNAYSLDLITYQSGIDPKFVVFSFKQPNLSSTKLRNNSFMTWFVHDYTSTVFDYDYLFLGGVTFIYPSTNEGSDVAVYFKSYLGGQHSTNTTYRYFSKRSAEFGYLDARTDASYTAGQGNPYVITSYSSTSATTLTGSSEHVKIYTRSNLDHTYRGKGGQLGEYAEATLENSTNFNAVIKGIPLSVKMAPVPYYLPDDFAMIDFDVATPSANIQQGDTITVSGTEVYTVISGSYNQVDRTRGILFCARTT